MDYISDDTPARDLAFDSESENSHFDDTINYTNGKDVAVAGGMAGVGKQEQFYAEGPALGSAVQDSIIEPETPELFYQEEDEKQTLKQYFHEKMQSNDIKKHTVWNMNQVTTEFANAIKPVLKKTSYALLSGQLKADNNNNMDVFDCTPDDILVALSNYNWSYNIKMKDGKVHDVLTDLDNIYVVHRMKEYKKNKRESPYVMLTDMTIDVEKGLVWYESNPSIEYQLVRSDINERSRSNISQRKGNGEQFILNQKPWTVNNQDERVVAGFKYEEGAFGIKWALTYKKSRYGLPSPKEIILGLLQYNDRIIESRMKGKSIYRIRQIKRQNRIVFRKIFSLIGFEDPEKDLNVTGPDGLHNPRSKATCFIMWLMSIEPSFYHAVNIASQTMDLDLLEELGPLSRAVYFVLTGAERFRDDQLENGFRVLMNNIKNPLQTFCQSHFLFRCVQMKQEHIDEWKELIDKRRKVPPKAVKALKKQTPLKQQNEADKQLPPKEKPATTRSTMMKKLQKKKTVNIDKAEEETSNLLEYVKLQGYTSVYESSRLALNFGYTDNPDTQMVLYVILMHNYNQQKNSTLGFRLNDSKYSAHYQEKEVLLAEGTPMVVLDVEEIQMDRFDRRTSVYDPFWDDYSGKTLTVIYLFNTHLV